MHILAIETSCDETSVSFLEVSGKKLKILSNEISSQVKLHAKWGGVVPNLAAREHTKNITTVFEISLQKAGIGLGDIDLIAVTQGPGLIPALLVGTSFAKTLSFLLGKPLLGIHHIEGHIYANLISKNASIKYPAISLVVSGGHTQLIYMKDELEYEIIGQTLDDAVGEAFDKVARILGIGYPGGPIVSKYADNFKLDDSEHKPIFPRPMINRNNFDFSFSGLKTAVLYETKKHPSLKDDEKYIETICHEFQQSAIDVLISKTIKAAKKFEPRTIMLAGGVSANKELRKQLGIAIENSMPDTSYQIPDIDFTGDNAAMIAAAAAIRWKMMNKTQKKKLANGWKTLQPDANLKLK